MSVSRQAVCGVAFLTGCVGTPETESLTLRSQPVPAGYTCSVSPSTAYAPGYVFRINESGASFLVMDARNRAETAEYSAALGSYNATLTSASSLSFALAPGGTSAEGNTSQSRSNTTKMSFKNGSFVLMDDQNETALLSIISGEIDRRPNNQYFMVRDAIQANGVQIILNSTDERTLGGETSVAELVSGKTNFTVTKVENLEINGDFEVPLNVCVRAVEIPIAPNVGDLVSPVIDNNDEQQTTVQYLAPEILGRALLSLETSR